MARCPGVLPVGDQVGRCAFLDQRQAQPGPGQPRPGSQGQVRIQARSHEQRDLMADGPVLGEPVIRSREHEHAGVGWRR